MALWSTTEPEITDADVELALRRAVRVVNPLLDVAWGTDPLGLKRRAPRAAPGAGPFERLAAGAAWLLNAGDLPGTQAWDEMDTEARLRWWVWRIGALNSVAVAYPGVLGAVGRLLPIQDLLGFVNQTVVLCAVARELGVTDEQAQARMLAEVLCERSAAGAGEPRPSSRASVRQVPALIEAIGDELAKRPQPRAPFRYLGMLPAVGAVASFFGECGALARAAKDGSRWVAERFPEAASGG
ncbi:MAG: hypothetical protein SW019_24935 [Actinomycetota bacterium]|nr:hypothetical protein [Actinomycetota bacterium]